MTAYDIVIVGGGVQGLWIARCAVQAGLTAAVVEARTCGAGASGGMLGALMPHVPTGWSEKKQFQFEALTGLGAEAATLTEETGIETGYVPCGRAMPVRSSGFLNQFESRRAASAMRWQGAAIGYELALKTPDALAGWLDPDQAPLGIFWDPLAARIEPGQYIAALRASIKGRCDILEDWRAVGYDAATRQVFRHNGDALGASRLVIAAGHESFGLVQDLFGVALGGGVKGQSALLAGRFPSERPILFDDGMYIVAHSQDLCAVGSTTEKAWEDASSTDEQIDARIVQARRLCPALRSAKVIGKWAGVRPQAAARDPIVGQIDPAQPIFIASGGFKITLGIAHLVARRLVEAIMRGDEPQGLPQSFAPERHLEAVRLREATLLAVHQAEE